MSTIGELNIGDKLKIKENGVAANYIIVHKGKPSDLYDDSCDGVWLLREEIHSNQVWDGTSSSCSNSYYNSDIGDWLNGSFISKIDEKISNEIKTVKIPYKQGTGNSSQQVQSGSNGLSCKVFLLSGYELGLTTSDNQYFPIDGARLSYFENGTSTSAKNKRIAKLNGSAAFWWLRSPHTGDAENAWGVSTGGSYGSGYAYYSRGARPAFILPSSLSISLFNNPPTITSDKTGNLGILNNGFTCNYSVDDADEDDSVSVKLDLDGNEISSYTAVKQQNETYSISGNNWLKITSGSHTFTISANDGASTTKNEITFTRECNKTVFSLETPLPADDVISICSLKIKGLIATDTILTCEVTNNANDTTPVWEDCTAKVKTEMVYTFKNKFAENGFAFNFRISAQRGASGAGGYITSIEGGFG